MKARFTAINNEHLAEFESLADEYSVKLTNKYSTPNAFWIETSFSIETDDEDVLRMFEELEQKYY